MNFGSMEEFNLWLDVNKKNNFAGGSQGECYKIGNKVFKIFSKHIDSEYDVELFSYDMNNIMQFKDILNNTYVWPMEPIMVLDEFVGYITEYINAKSLFKINPLKISLDKFEDALCKAEKDIKVVSDNGVLSYDVAYNILYGRNGFKIIDTLDYVKSDADSKKLYYQNLKNFYYEIRLFLIDGYFDNFVYKDSFLYNLCCSNDGNFILFLKEFRKRLSEIEGYEISRLGEAKKSILVKEYSKCKYIRELGV